MQPPPYLRDKVKIALPHLKEEISAVIEGGGQPLPAATEIQNHCGYPSVPHRQAPPLREAPPLRCSCSSPRPLTGHCAPVPALSILPTLPPPSLLAKASLSSLGEPPGPAQRSAPGHAHLHNWLKGAKGAIAGAPVVAVTVHALLQDVLFAGEAYPLIGHPPAGRAWDESARAGSALLLDPPCAWGGDYSHAAEHVDGLRAGSVLG